MIRKKLLFIPFLAVLLGMVSCLEDDGNYTTVPDFAVIGSNSQMGGTTLCTSKMGEVAAPSLTGYKIGDCAYVFFKIDYDKQPSSNYLTATEIEIMKIDQKPLNITSEGDAFFSDYVLPFTGLAPYLSYVYNGKFFLEIGYKANVGEKVTYEIFCDPAEVNENGVFAIYLRGKFTESEDYSSNNPVVDIYAFDARQLITTYGKYTTEDKTTYQYVDVYFKYFKGYDKSGNPEYGYAEGNSEEKPYRLILL